MTVGGPIDEANCMSNHGMLAAQGVTWPLPLNTSHPWPSGSRSVFSLPVRSPACLQLRAGPATAAGAAEEQWHGNLRMTGRLLSWRGRAAARMYSTAHGGGIVLTEKQSPYL